MKKYKGYGVNIQYSNDDELMVGQIENIDSLILFSADNLRDLKAEFHQAVDEYIADCERDGLEPEKPYKGSFNVRVGPESHRRAARTANDWGVTLNEFVRIALDQAIDRHAHASQGVVTMVRKESVLHPAQYLVDAPETPSLSNRPAYN